MEVSQRSGPVEEPPGHRWAAILGTGVAIVTLTLPIIMIASYSPSGSNAQPIPQATYQTKIRANSME
ncbi:hypothetical protein C7B62_18725 [Pleurocapsa sp. CCALA 161]|uniref:hypothetical protein n=1 Tax=Pleurocapsa sp. CCALA 161 TaxID=2107688 RepID=UPI000D0761B9|nr:hypothetical protein [Pleurocapsa sp. CCALA 161]PSB07823.1 hypothetical protein C7B62_18725 [Pleurocapsa sp. CCALA 161]